MKAKNILRISLFAVVLCLTLIFAVMADDLDAKIIRFDGTGNVDVDSYDLRLENQGLAVEETDGVLRVTGGSYDSVNENSDVENFFFIRFAVDDYIDLNTYPYYVIKFKTNDAYAADAVKKNSTAVITQVYFLKANATGYRYKEDNSGYHDCLAAPSGYDFTDMWRTYMYKFSDADDGVNKVSGQTLAEGEKLCGVRFSPAKYFKNDYETMAKLVLDIEYIGFFQTKADAESYIDRSSVIIRFDGNEDRAAVSLSGSGSPTVTDGLCKITLDTSKVENTGTAVAQPNFTLANAANLPYSIFSIDTYRYGTLKLKSTVNVPNFQLYTLQFNHLTKDNPYLYIAKNLPVSDDFQEYSFDAYGISNGSLLTGEEPKSHPNVTNPFMQFKGFTATGTTVETAEIKHIAYFKNADDRDAFVAGAMDTANDNVKAAYKAIVNARNSVIVNTETEAEEAVKTKVEELLGSDSNVNVTYDITGLKVIVTLTATETYGTGKTYTATKTVGFDVNLPEEDHSAKIIRFGTAGDGNVQTSIEGGGKGVKTVTADGILRIDMAASDMFKADASSEPTFKIETAEQFNLKDYPYVKIKMRTNYPAIIQYYAANRGDDVTCRADIYRMPNGSTNADIANSEWHEVEFSFDKSYTDNYCFVDIGAAETAKVSAPFFQFKSLKATPDHDLFAEIEYIAYFQSEEDMKAYGKEEEKVVLTGDELHSVVADSTELEDSNIIRIYSTGKEGDGTTVDIKEVFDKVYGEKLDLYEYPYVKLKFRTTYTGTIQLYLFDETSYRNYVGFADAVKDGEWHNATLSYNYKDITGGASASGTSNAIKLTTDGVAWEVKTINSGLFPSRTGEFKLDGFKFQLKTALQEGNYLDIAYIAFYKTKEAMLADTSYDTDSAKVEAALEVAIPDFTLHNAIGVGELENHVRETIENDVAGVSVLAKAQSFDRKGTTCDVAVTVTCGDVSKTETKTVNLINKDFTLETLGAQIRDASGEGETKIEQGLRFGTKFAYDEEFYENVKFGTLLLPTKYFNSAYSFEKVALTPANWTGNVQINDTPKLDEEGAVIEGKFETHREKALDASGVYTYDFTDYKIFTAVLTEIKEADESTVIIARPYVTYTVDGTEYTYYGDKIERSVAQVEAAIEAEKADKVVSEDAKWSNTTND